MHIMHNFGNVRVVSEGDPMVTSYDIRVEVKEHDERWVMYQGFNSISDDYAYTNARDVARQLASDMTLTRS